jgi:hypothetical protein
MQARTDLLQLQLVDQSAQLDRQGLQARQGQRQVLAQPVQPVQPVQPEQLAQRVQLEQPQRSLDQRARPAQLAPQGLPVQQAQQAQPAQQAVQVLLVQQAQPVQLEQQALSQGQQAQLEQLVHRVDLVARALITRLAQTRQQRIQQQEN